MILEGQGILPSGQGARAREVLADVSSWAEWVPGLRVAEADTNGVRLQFADPMRSSAVVEVMTSESGMALQLVEGTPTELSARVDVRPESVHLRAVVRLQSLLPGPLRAELEQGYPARFVEALLSRL